LHVLCLIGWVLTVVFHRLSVFFPAHLIAFQFSSNFLSVRLQSVLLREHLSLFPSEAHVKVSEGQSMLDSKSLKTWASMCFWIVPILSTRTNTFPQVVVVAADMCCGSMYSPEWVVSPKFKSIQSLANQNLHATYQFSSRLQKFYATKARQKIFAKIRPCVDGGSNRWRPKNARVAQSRRSAPPILLPNHVEQNLCIALRSVPVGEG